MFGKNLNKSKFYSGKNEEQTQVRECVLSLGSESLVFHFATRKIKE